MQFSGGIHLDLHSILPLSEIVLLLMLYNSINGARSRNFV
jgi:hypothetical protein